jgi:hypothetical protein
MGNKTYFEFLEEEYQSLSSQLQSSLSKAAATTDENNNDDDTVTTTTTTRTMQIQLTRCKAVLQQLKSECKGDAEYKERVKLYKIQLDALEQHFQLQHEE